MDASQDIESFETKEYVETHKFNEWVRYFLDKTNAETYGNAGRSALKAYNTESINCAYVIGHQNLRKYKILSARYAEDKGYGLGKMIDLAIQKMEQSGDIRWWERAMKLFGYVEEDKPTTIITATQTNTIQQNTLTIEQKKEMTDILDELISEVTQDEQIVSNHQAA